MVTVHDVAAAIIVRLGEITAMKLEKLVYYSQAWHLARHRTPLFGEPIQAWRQGPVTPNLYRHHRRCYHVEAWPLGDPAALNAEQMRIIDWVATHYGPFSGVELSRMTHAELPWRAARGALPDTARSTAEIRQDVMADYFRRQSADSETAVTIATASAALEGTEFDPDWEDRLRDVASGVVSADQAVAAEIARLRRG